VLLACRSLDLQLEMLRVLERASDDVVERALTRLVRFKAQWSAPPSRSSDMPSAPPYPDHEALAAALRRPRGVGDPANQA